ncbi:MAG: putative bifunctional protein [Actinobacteria bacterium]|nr:putative bifunctional protein [Actinomycetota bacterium]
MVKRQFVSLERYHFANRQEGSVTTLPGRSLNPSDTVPLYRHLYEHLRASILGGQVSAGTRLPSTRALAAQMGVSRNTVLAAFEQLHAEGYLEGRLGSGTYVARTLPEELLAAGPQTPATSGALPAAPRASGPARRLSERGERIATGARTPLPALSGRSADQRAFTIGLPDLDAFPWDVWARLLARRMRESPRHLMRYSHPAGYLPLRHAIAAHLATARGVRCTAEQVIIVTGSQQALDLCARLLLDPGDPAWIEDPGYLGARAALAAAGAELVPVPVDDEGLDVASGKGSSPDARLAVVTPSHQFPLGVTMSLSRRLALIDWAHGTGSWVVEDDYDAEFRYVGKPLTALQGIDEWGCVIYVGTFSKVLFPGLRLGYLVAPPQLVDPFIAAHLATDMHAHMLEQAVLSDFIQDGQFERHLRRMRVLYAERQAILVAAVRRELEGIVDVNPSDNGLHLIGWLAPGLDDDMVAREAADNGVDVWPLSLHSLHPYPRAALLLGYASLTPLEIHVGVQRLARALSSLRGSAGCRAGCGQSLE